MHCLMQDDRILIKVIEEGGESKTSSGLIIPQTVAPQSQGLTGVIVAVGPGHLDTSAMIIRQLPMPYRAGQKVIVNKYVGLEMLIERERHVVVRATDIVALVVEEEEAVTEVAPAEVAREC